MQSGPVESYIAMFVSGNNLISEVLLEFCEITQFRRKNTGDRIQNTEYPAFAAIGIASAEQAMDKTCFSFNT